MTLFRTTLLFRGTNLCSIRRFLPRFWSKIVAILFDILYAETTEAAKACTAYISFIRKANLDIWIHEFRGEALEHLSRKEAANNASSTALILNFQPSLTAMRFDGCPDEYFFLKNVAVFQVEVDITL